ncbi:rhodanese-like domain-containing protein [Maridesulfovibrio sp.]|uniref:rhodanese-like domain-containing protein n=1 Tax=Maridesulfovibrio sp. TaxID=2795000 RepID=UPI002A18A5B9|nr:rhodanese-like domain-containing protein [Maridesulfovibrio sp.]
MKLHRLAVPFMMLLMALTASVALAGDFNYISPADMKAKMEQGEPMLIVDIQVADEFAQHHLKGAVKTTAYPVKSDEDKAKLQDVLGKAKKDNLPVVIICPRGKGGAKRAYDYMKENGVDEGRLLILEDGQQGWPYPELLAKD